MGRGVGVMVGLGVRVGPPGVMVAVAVGTAVGMFWQAVIINKSHRQASFRVNFMGKFILDGIRGVNVVD